MEHEVKPDASVHLAFEQLEPVDVVFRCLLLQLLVSVAWTEAMFCCEIAHLDLHGRDPKD